MASVLILGAGSDVAKALAHLYASKGNSIQLAARNAEQLSALKSDIEIRWNVPCSTLEFDAGNFEEIEKKFSRIEPLPDIAICVFGYLGDNNISLKFWSESEKTIVANYAGAMAILNALAVRFADRKSGTIVGVSSVAGERGRQSNFIYGSAKAGFSVYLDGLRNWLFSKNVHVVTVKPGFIFTRMTDNLKLPPLLTATPELVAKAIEKAVRKKKNTIYVKWFWRYIMLIIKCIPEFMFKKMKM